MNISSFDIFDTCLVRTCGTPENFFDVLAYRVFDGDVDDYVRTQFIIARRRCELSISKTDPFFDIYSIYNSLDFRHDKLKEISLLPEIEMQLEKELLRPVLKTKELIKNERKKGRCIIFISDMYLHSDFLIPVLKQFEMFEDGDRLYISSEKGAVKYGGGLYRLIQRELNIPYKKWKEEDYSICYKYASIAAGISRALYHSEPDNTHKGIVLDLIAPFYCSYVYRVMKDAKKKGFNKLYFCARDAIYFFHIAEQLQPLFPEITIKYLLISRDALYNSDPNTVLEYMKQEGLAGKNSNNAIVDTTTSGKTIYYLNALFEKNGFPSIYGYYLFHWDDSKRNEELCDTLFQSEIRETNIFNNSKYAFLCHNFYIFENFFSLNSNKHLSGYEQIGSIINPVYDDDTTSEECSINDVEKWAVIHNDLISKFTSEFIKTRLYNKSEELFNLVFSSILSFFRFPEKEYLSAFLTFSSFFSNKPVIKKCRLAHLILYKGKDTEWPIATKIFNLPKQISFFIKMRYRNKNLL